jgi:hypothetical protein
VKVLEMLALSVKYDHVLGAVPNAFFDENYWVGLLKLANWQRITFKIAIQSRLFADDGIM